ncbi:UbiA family prenyltransferase [Pseudolysinimonas sp.]|uniref:UbiA family prenyltransferase n=1 Tax=Pseudolysinimonas sp. TaxID=2680009 RepID=UPI00286A1F6E|nr:UbiA family prenyltransferase [Pseudolysinimonas sp.]
MTLITVLLGVAVGLDPLRVALLGLTMAFTQLSVGLSNDWLDAARDRDAGRRDKPVARGEIAVSAVRTAALTSAGLGVLASLTLGIPFAIVHLVALGGGWAYNAWFKHRPLSPVPYLVSFGLLPMLATLALPVPALAAWWAVLAGSLLGIAAHVANVLPDLADDAATGVRGLPHRLGRVGSTLLGGLSLSGAAIALTLGIGLDSPVALFGFGLSLAASVAAVVFTLRENRWGFRFVIVAALIDVVLLVLAGNQMVVAL